jgi:hypothetical protein
MFFVKPHDTYPFLQEHAVCRCAAVAASLFVDCTVRPAETGDKSRAGNEIDERAAAIRLQRSLTASSRVASGMDDEDAALWQLSFS